MAVADLVKLKSPEEMGTKLQFDKFKGVLASHAVVTWYQGADVGYVLKQQKKPDMNPPTALTEDEEKDRDLVDDYRSDRKDHRARVKAFEANLKAMYTLVMANVSDLTKSKVKACVGYTKASEKMDLLWLMGNLNDIMVGFVEGVKPETLVMDEQLGKVYNMKQKPGETNEEFFKVFLREVEVYEKRGGKFLWSKMMDKRLVQAMKEKKTAYAVNNSGSIMPVDEEEEERRVQEDILKEEIAAMALIKRSDKIRYGSLLIQLKNGFLKKLDGFPKTVAEALRLLDNFQLERPDANNTQIQVAPRTRTPRTGPVSGGVNRNPSASFLQASGQQVVFIRGTNNSFHPNTTCHLCKLKGHFQQQCPVASDATGARLSRVESERNPTTRQEVSFAICGILLNHQGDILINPNWVLLDSESTHNIFKNRNMLTDVKATTDGEILRLHTSGGILDTNQKGHFGGLSVWFNPRCLANILSLALVSELFRVTLDTEIENAFTVHISEAHVMNSSGIVCV